MMYEVPQYILSRAEEFWDEEDLPLLRDPKAGEIVLVLGWSTGQELPVLYSKDISVNEDRAEDVESAEEAAQILSERDIPSGFTCDGKVVGRLKSGFYDGNGDWWDEITFSNVWHATLLQRWFDENEIPICIQVSSSMRDEKVITDHVSLARYDIDRAIKYAAFKDMSIRHEIREYVTECWKKRRELPSGSHFMPSGTLVTFIESL